MVLSTPDPLVPDPDGSTPLDPDEIAQLRPSWVRTRGDLNRAEAEAIAATQRSFARRVPPLETILDDLWLRQLHARMFGAVWGWAGSYRSTERNIGVDRRRIAVESLWVELQKVLVWEIQWHGRPCPDTIFRMAIPSQSVVDARRDTVPVRLLPDHLIAIGEPVASIERICSLVGLSPRSVHSGLSRLRRQGRLFSPARGLYVAVPPEYRSWGVVPASWFIDTMMQHLSRSYYVGLLTAAAIHGASHQHPQVFQVMVDRQLGDRDLGRVRLQFHVAARLHSSQPVPTVEVATHTGTMTVASPELVVVDIVADPNASGGIDNVVTVLTDLPDLDIAVLASACANVPRAVVRRVGWLLENIVGISGLEQLRELASPDIGEAAPLDVHGLRAGYRDPGWGIIENVELGEGES